MTLTPERGSRLDAAFAAAFGRAPAARVRAPGRVNLIGEHTDYNEGLVMPAAIDREALFALAPLPEPEIRIVAADRGGEEARFAFEEADAPADARHWSAYARGVVAAWREEGLPLAEGLALAFDSDVPAGAGLSSSAAYAVGVATALAARAPFAVPRLTLARIAQRAEHTHAKVPCGIMDQYASAFGAAGCALMLDCRSLTHETIALPPEAALLVVDTGIRRALTESAYAQRREDCAEACERLSFPMGRRLRSLREVSPADLVAFAGGLPDRIYRRARHVVTENVRVQAFATALVSRDLALAGTLMDEAHDSLARDFEVSLPAIDALAERLRGVPGVHGARLTGAGFGGCLIVLAAPEAAEGVEAVLPAYAAETGNRAALHRVRAAGGAGPWAP